MSMNLYGGLAERRFRGWMLLSAWVYAITGVFILSGGGWIVGTINAISLQILPSLPLYPLPANSAEGKFWLVLGSTMLALITYVSRAAYLDPQRNARLVPILLLAKFCSSGLYLAFFLVEGSLVYLAAFCTDAPLLLVTFVVWIPIAGVDSLIGRVDEDIIAAIGEAMFPRGGAFELGYADFREECIADVRTMFASYYPHVLLGVKLMLRAIDWLPVVLFYRPTTIRHLSPESRQQFLKKLENHWFFGFRMMMMAVKLFVAMPFFNRAATTAAVGATVMEPDA